MSLECPHCAIAFHRDNQEVHRVIDSEAGWTVVANTCPSCLKLILHLRKHSPLYVGVDKRPGGHNFAVYKEEILLKPKRGTRKIPPEVPEKYAKDFREAVAVLQDSPRASAALSRFCLQKLLREEVKVKHGDLVSEIQQVLDSGKLPSSIAASIDAIRNIGNFAAHPNKSLVSGEIAEVEISEAEWTIDVLESLFDYYLVQPERIRLKTETLNAKLLGMGKPPLKK